MPTQTQTIFPNSKRKRENKRISFNSKRERDKYLLSIVPLEVENLVNAYNINDKDYITILETFKELTLTYGTTLYIENDNDILLLNINHIAKEKSKIAINQKKPLMQPPKVVVRAREKAKEKK